MNKLNLFVVFLTFFQINCGNSKQVPVVSPPTEAKELILGAARLDAYLPMIKGKKVALVVNQTSTIGERHLVDTLLKSGVLVQTVFSPEHGFRGEADAGEKITDGKDPKTGVALVSLYGKKRKPGAEDLKGIDWVIFDIQDVGARFYTYISTMAYVMEACAMYNVPFLVLDRPNPNGHYVDGPILDLAYQSFVGMHQIPIVHGMTVGEYAQMVNGEGWLPKGIKCQLKVVTCENYDHQTAYELPIKPSPNLPNIRSIYLYPSLCFFEGTVASVGRGTNTQFQVYGHPDFPENSPHVFMPVSMPGATNPKLKNKLCKGFDLTKRSPEEIRAESRINLSYLIDSYRNFPDQESFFLKNNWIDKLAGGSHLREQIIAGKTEEEIRASWQTGLDAFKQVRAKYLLYEE